MTHSTAESVRLLFESLKIYSPTTEEAEFASFLSDEMNRLGYTKVHIDRAGNVLGEVGRGKTTLLLCGHMDTVPGKIPVRKTKDTIYGRGAADAKSPLCALLIAGALAADFGMRVTFAGATEEEGDGAGIEQLATSGTRFDYAVFGEPSGADGLTIGYRGRVVLSVAVKTVGGHASSPWAHKSAFDEFTLLLTKLREYERSKQIEGDHFHSLSLSPTLVRAGSYQNVIPSSCDAVLDLRLPPSISSSQALADIRALPLDTEGVKTTITPGPPTEAYEANIDSRLIRAFQRAIIIRLKTKPRFVRKTGTGDMNTFARKQGAECLTYGPGLSRTSHTDGEQVQIRDYLNSIEVIEEAMRQLTAM